MRKGIWFIWLTVSIGLAIWKPCASEALITATDLCPFSAECVVTQKQVIADSQGIDVRPLTLRIKAGAMLGANPLFPLTIKAGAIVVEKGGSIIGNIDGGTGNTLTLIAEVGGGGDGLVTVAGTVEASARRVNGSGGDGGSISITAAGACAVTGKVLANGAASTSIGGSGGTITLDGTTIDIGQGARVEASAAGPSGTGGNIYLAASVGALTLSAGSTVRAVGSGLDGGSVSLSTDTDDVNDACNISGKIVADSKTVMSAGGAGGGLDISCGGDVNITKGAGISLNGLEGGGTVDLFSGRDLIIGSGASFKANASDSSGGSIDMLAANSATVAGKLEARTGGASPNDGSISVTAGGDLSVAKGAILNASAGRKEQQTGQIILAGGIGGGASPRLTIEQGAVLKATGHGSGFGAVDIDLSDSACTIGGKIKADAALGNGAAISIVCDSVALESTSIIQAKSSGAFGGSLTIDTTGAESGVPGDCVLGGKVTLRGSTARLPNLTIPGYGGRVDATCGLGLSVPDRAKIDVGSSGALSAAGQVNLRAEQPIHIRGSIAAKSAGAATVGGRIAVSGPYVFLEAAPGALDVGGESGGTIDLSADQTAGSGVITIDKPLNAKGAPRGGNVVVRGCNVFVGPSGWLRADGAFSTGGINEIAARNELAIIGKMTALFGENRLLLSAGMQPTLSGTFSPVATEDSSLTPCP